MIEYNAADPEQVKWAKQELQRQRLMHDAVQRGYALADKYKAVLVEIKELIETTVDDAEQLPMHILHIVYDALGTPKEDR